MTGPRRETNRGCAASAWSSLVSSSRLIWSRPRYQRLHRPPLDHRVHHARCCHPCLAL